MSATAEKPKVSNQIENNLSEAEINQLQDEADRDDEQSENGGNVETEASKVTVPKEVIEKLRKLTPRQQEAADEDLERGVELFFSNKYEEAELIFQQRSDVDPLAAQCHGCLGFLRGVMSFAKPDLELAFKRFSKSEHIANQVIPREGYVSSAAKFLRISSNGAPMPNSTLRANVVKAESNLLMACLLVLQESVYSFVKAGFALRRAWKCLQTAWKALTDAKDKASEIYDRHTISGVLFGMGTFNVLLSGLPPKFVSFISIMGLPHNNALGMKQLNDAMTAGGKGGIRSAMASCFLLTIHGVVPSFAPVLVEKHVAEASAIYRKCMEIYPVSCIHLWIGGRISRSQRNITEAIERFELSANSQNTFNQLKHVNWYDMAWCYAFRLEWDSAAQLFAKLAEENEWSKAFYVYAEASCLQMAGHNEKALELFKKAPEYIVRKYGGRVISAEQFVQHRAAQIEQCGQLPFLPGLELVSLFNGFCQAEPECLERALAVVMEAQSTQISNSDALPLRGQLWHISSSGISC